MTDPATNEDKAAASAESELSATRWALVSFEKCEASGITYSEAAKLMAELEREHIAGLCIVTAAAAARLAG
jgi:hypothetical protein